MIKVKIDDQEIKIPTELTIEKYQKIQKSPDKYKDPAELLALYIGISLDELKDLPVEEISFMESVLSSHLNAPTSDLIYTFTHNGVLYGLENDWGNMKFGQWTDMEVFSQPDKVYESIHILLALLYRPIEIQKDQKTYVLTEYKNADVLPRATEFLTAPVNIWFGCANFFFHISREYISNIENSLRWKMEIRKKWMRIMNRRFLSFLLPKRLRDSILNWVSNLLEKI